MITFSLKLLIDHLYYKLRRTYHSFNDGVTKKGYSFNLQLETILQRETREAEEEEEETHNSLSRITKIPNRNDKKKKPMIEKTIAVQNRKANVEKTLF